MIVVSMVVASRGVFEMNKKSPLNLSGPQK